ELTVALNSIEGAARTPPSQVIALYRQAAHLAALRLADWQKLHGSLTALNRQLQAAGLAPINIP
ncbi:MAG: hypothetical protein ACRD3Y_01025, partial [Bryobacteraceae bacterium]